MEWPYYQKHVNQITLNHTTCYYVVLLMSEVFVQMLLDVSLFLNQTLLAFLQYKTNLDVTVDSGNFSVRHYLPWVCILCEGGISFGWDSSTSRKLSQFLFMFLTGFTHAMSYGLLFPVSVTFFISVHSFCCCFI